MKKIGIVVSVMLLISCSILTAGQTTIQNSPPYTPEKPDGPEGGLLFDRVLVGYNYTYTTTTTDPDGDDVWYNWSWGDGTYSGWVGPKHSGAIAKGKHKWTEPGTYSVQVKAKDTSDAESGWSDSLEVWVRKGLIGVVEGVTIVETQSMVLPEEVIMAQIEQLESQQYISLQSQQQQLN